MNRRRLALVLAAGVVSVLSWLVAVPISHWSRCSYAFEGSPSWSPDGRRIAFSKKIACDTAIFVIDDGGHEVRRIPGSKSGDEYPAWSHDGRRLVVSGREGFIQLDMRGGRTTLALGRSDFGGAWSPIDDRLAYTHGDLPDVFFDEELKTTLYISADGRRHRLVGHRLSPGTPTWSPDGSRLAFSATTGMFVISANGTGLRRLVRWGYNTNPTTVSWSPDARNLALVDELGLQLVDVRMGRRRWLFRAAGSLWPDSATWSPDGRLIAFSRTDAGKGNGIFVIGANGRGLHRVAVLGR